MAGEPVTSVEDVQSAKGGAAGKKQRSTIEFPYDDLDSVVEMAMAMHSQVGVGDCDDDQLAAWTNQSPKSSGYRTQVYAARMFGLLEYTPGGRRRLTALGRRIVDPDRTREVRAQAFLNVALYKQLFEKYKGGVLPATAALEREIESLGVAQKVKDRARRTFERSAEQAGFFEQGRNRLVMPAVALREGDTPPVEPPLNPGSGGGGGSGRHPFIQGLLDTLPPTGSEKTEWTVEERIKWLQTAANIFDLIYKGGGGIEVREAHAQRSPRPGD